MKTKVVMEQMASKQKRSKSPCLSCIPPSDVILSVCRANKFFGIVQTTAKKSSLTATQCEKSCRAKKWCVQFKIRSKQKKQLPQKWKFPRTVPKHLYSLLSLSSLKQYSPKILHSFFRRGNNCGRKMKDFRRSKFVKLLFLSRLDQSKKVFKESKKQVKVIPLFKRVVFWRERNGRGNMSREGETLSSVKKWVPFCTVTFSPEHILARSKLSFEYCSQKWLLFSKLRRRMIY